MNKIKTVNVKAKTRVKFDDDYNEYTETIFRYSDYSEVSLRDIKVGDSVIMTSVSFYDINGGDHSLFPGTIEEIKSIQNGDEPWNAPSENCSLGISFKITKNSECSVRVKSL